MMPPPDYDDPKWRARFNAVSCMQLSKSRDELMCFVIEVQMAYVRGEIPGEDVDWLCQACARLDRVRSLTHPWGGSWETSRAAGDKRQ